MTIVAVVFILLISAFSTYGFSIIVEYVLIKHIMDDPIKGLIVSIILGWFITVLWQTWLSRMDLIGFAINIGGLLGALGIAYPGIRRRRNQQRAEGQVAQTFD